jgi:hypothetical protein
MRVPRPSGRGGVAIAGAVLAALMGAAGPAAANDAGSITHAAGAGDASAAA